MVGELGAKGPKAEAEPLPVKPAWMVPDDDDSPPSKVVLHQRLYPIKGRLQAKSSSIKGHLPSKVVFKQSLLPSNGDGRSIPYPYPSKDLCWWVSL